MVRISLLKSFDGNALMKSGLRNMNNCVLYSYKIKPTAKTVIVLLEITDPLTAFSIRVYRSVFVSMIQPIVLVIMPCKLIIIKLYN